MKSKTIFFLSLILFLSIFLHFFRLSHPQSVVFDEQWYASSVYSYFKNTHYFDVHPPLGKLLIAASGYLFGFEKPLSDNNFNYRFDDPYPRIKNYLPLRFLPAFLGALLPLLGWLTARSLGASEKSSFLVAIFFLFENALLVQSRLILLEIILVFFSLFSLFFYLQYKKQKKYTKKKLLFLFLLGISLGCAISVKWTGLIILVIVVFLELIRLDNEQSKKKAKLFSFLSQKKKEIGKLFLFLIILPVLFYLASFAVHFSLTQLPKNPSDMTDPFLYGKEEKTEKTFSDISYKAPEGNFFQKLVKTHKHMLGVVGIEKEHPYSSHWWQWVFGEKPMLYYLENNSRLYLMGNSLVWFCGFLGVFMFFLIPLYKKKEKIKSPKFFKEPTILYFYLFSWLFFIGVLRTSFLYYYLIPLCFSIIIFGLCFDFYTQKLNKKTKNIIFVFLIILCFLAFVFFLPLTYGFPLSDKAVLLREAIPF